MRLSLFRRKNIEDLITIPPATNRVEVEVHKNATKEAAEKANQANQHLNDLLLANGFTLKIYLAAGGQVHQKQGGKK